MRREQPLPHGLRGLVADLHSAGAAVDFSVLYPDGQLVDAPLPAWANRPLLLAAEHRDRQAADRQFGCGASAVGLARAADGGTGAPCLAGRGRHRRAALVVRPPNP